MKVGELVAALGEVDQDLPVVAFNAKKELREVASLEVGLWPGAALLWAIGREWPGRSFDPEEQP